MRSLESILDTKGRNVHVVSATDSAFRAVEVMCQAHVGAVLVIEGEALAGIFSRRDLMTRVVLAMRDPMETQVREVMTRNAVCASLDTTVHDAMTLMTERRIRHVPVVERSRIVGVVSIGDLVSSIVVEREIEIEQLHDYVTGRYPG